MSETEFPGPHEAQMVERSIIKHHLHLHRLQHHHHWGLVGLHIVDGADVFRLCDSQDNK